MASHLCPAAIAGLDLAKRNPLLLLQTESLSTKHPTATGKRGNFIGECLRTNARKQLMSSSFLHSVPVKPRAVTQKHARLVVQAVQTAEPEVKEQTAETELLACPICYEPLIRTGPRGLTQAALDRSGFKCGLCKRAFSTRQGYADLTVTAGAKVYQESKPAGTQLFRSPYVSFVYERGWRQSFARAGFPGADEEFKMAQEFLEPARGGVLLDVSCGSGLFSRRFAASGDYETVIASDFSETMLEQTASFVRDDPLINRNSGVVLVRADVARLPFRTATIDAVHAGAALHCWPSPSSAVADISRVLKPGGVFVATTFLQQRAPVANELLKPLRQALMEQTGSPRGMRYWEEKELEELVKTCGLVDYRVIRIREFIMLCARKPM